MNTMLKKAVSPRNNRFLFLEVLEALGERGASPQSSAPLICLTSAGPRDGKSFTAISLATQIAKGGEGKVLLVDNGRGGKRSPTGIFAPGAKVGWPEVVRGETPLEEVLREHVQEGVDLLPGPPQDRWEGSVPLMRDPRFRALLESLRGRYRYIVADCPSLSEGPVANEFLRWADGVLLVLEYGKNSAVRVREYLSRLGSAREKILGVVINKRRYPIPQMFYSRL